MAEESVTNIPPLLAPVYLELDSPELWNAKTHAYMNRGLNPQSTPPATNGWYNASKGGAYGLFRYWNGEYWSTSVDVTGSRWRSKHHWELAKSKRESAFPSLVWRNVKPYYPGDEWEFLRE